MMKQALMVSRLFFLHLANKIFLVIAVAVLMVSCLLSVQLFVDYYKVIDFFEHDRFNNSVILNRISSKYELDSLVSRLESEDSIEKVLPVWVDETRDSSDCAYDNDFICLYDYSNMPLSSLNFVDGSLGKEKNAIVLSENARDRYSIGDEIKLQIDNTKLVYDDGEFVEKIDSTVDVVCVITGFFSSNSTCVSFSRGSNPPDASIYLTDIFSLDSSDFDGYYAAITRSLDSLVGESTKIERYFLPVLKIEPVSGISTSDLYKEMINKYEDVGYFVNLHEALDNYIDNNKIQKNISLMVAIISVLLLVLILISDIRFGLANDKEEYQLYYLLGNTRADLKRSISLVYILCCVFGWLIGSYLYKAGTDLFRNEFDIVTINNLYLIESFVLLIVVIIIVLALTSFILNREAGKDEANIFSI